MKATVIDSSVLSTQGGIGSRPLGVPNPAPAQGPLDGSGPDGLLSVQAASPEATAGAAVPVLYGDKGLYGNHGQSMEPDSQYDTIDPIPEG